MAFENSLYVDYVTEKLFNNLKRLIIPIVFGGADYKKFAPPKSYIDANEFESVQKLIEYLKFLDQHPEEYIKYFWWKKFYRVKEATPLCDLCIKLHGLDYEYDHRHEYKNVREWWYGKSCEREARIRF
jgi:alpha-1,3-fucosyltransferase